MTAPLQPTFRLRRYFSIASGALMLAVVLPLAYAYYTSEVREQTAFVGLRNQVLARTYANALWPAYGEFLLREDLAPDARRAHASLLALDAQIRDMSRDVPVIKIKVYNPRGVAAYSSVLAEIGEDKSANSAFVEARDGRLVNELTHRGRISASEGEILNVDVVSTYIPIRAAQGGAVTAVFELYSDVTEAVSRIEKVTIRLLAALAAVFAVLYLSLLAIVARADAILRRQYEALKENESRLESKTRELEREILERHDVERALRHSEEVAATASRAKSEFLSGMSHELRTPMNAIIGFAQLLETEPDAPLKENQRKFVRQIMKAADHLLWLINQVLDLARIEAGKLTLSLEPVGLKALLEESLPLIQHLLAQKRIAPVALDLQVERVIADHVRLKQVMLNLLSNAVKYNREGGSVSVAATRDGPMVRIAVADTGRGIPEAQKAELFQPFSRLGIQSADVEGTGIGLTVSKHLVEAMGGSIGVESRAGEGSTFWLSLPAAPEKVEAPSGSDTPAPAWPAGTGGTESPEREKVILYVEDNPANLLLMEELVRRVPGVRFVSAHNAELGIALALAERPDLVIMDINLPGMDGYQALARLRANPATAAIPVMALSANAMPSDIERGLAAGFHSYHTKPLHVSSFTRAMRAALDGVPA
jgi:signal transduction histidine kinase